MKLGLFAGLITLDCIYQADHAPAANEKVVASRVGVAAGGPATNAAVAFGRLERQNRSRLAGALGQHSLSDLVRADLAQWDVGLVDLQAQLTAPPPVSSIVVSATGERAVVSRNAVDRQVLPSPEVLEALLGDVNILLIDGHQMELGRSLATLANSRSIPVIIDAGSWKPGFEQVLPLAEVVIASANFQPPQAKAGAIAYLQDLGIPHIAVTRGEQAILAAEGTSNPIAIPVPQVAAVDTLGAGDTLHGAFCHFYPEAPFVEALRRASEVATFACQFFGTRDWLVH